MSKINMPVEINLEDLAILVNHEDGMKLIKMIDENMEDWNFTEECFKHFARIIHSFYKDFPEEGNIDNLLKEIDD